MSEFIYFNTEELAFPLAEHIAVSSQIPEQTEGYLVSNSSAVHAEIIANEIDFYISNTKDPLAQQIKNVEKLYEINALRFDLAKDVPYTQEVSNTLLVIGEDEEQHAFFNATNKDEFDLLYMQAEQMVSMAGSIGNLSVIAKDKQLTKDVILNVAQVVWFNQGEISLKQSGTLDPLKSSIEEVVTQLRKNIEGYEYKKFTSYDPTICQYHERREEICGRCFDVCPTTAIMKIDAQKHLEFSQIDCHGCGGCISVCPSGALDYAPSSKESIFEMARYLNGHIPLIIPQKMSIETLNVPLKEKILPFKIEGEKFLHEGTLLTLLQESGSQLIFYSDFISKGTGDAINILNDIYQKKYAKDAIFIAKDENELKVALEEIQFIENSRFTFNEENAQKKEIFSYRLSQIVGDENLGVVKTGEHIHYGTVKVNEEKCTLCLSCVGACNVDALIADPDTYELKLNPSVCTSCGYCEVSCPEKDCLSIEHDTLRLEPSWFHQTVIAKDTLFACVECGEHFATTKSVEKIAAMMAPLFASNPVKERTLYCCENCKPKLMIQQGLLDA